MFTVHSLLCCSFTVDSPFHGCCCWWLFSKIQSLEPFCFQLSSGSKASTTTTPRLPCAYRAMFGKWQRWSNMQRRLSMLRELLGRTGSKSGTLHAGVTDSAFLCRFLMLFSEQDLKEICQMRSPTAFGWEQSRLLLPSPGDINSENSPGVMCICSTQRSACELFRASLIERTLQKQHKPAVEHPSLCWNHRYSHYTRPFRCQWLRCSCIKHCNFQSWSGKFHVRTELLVAGISKLPPKCSEDNLRL